MNDEENIKVGDLVTYKEPYFPNWTNKLVIEVTRITSDGVLFHGKVVKNEVTNTYNNINTYTIGHQWKFGTVDLVRKVELTQSGKVKLNT